MIFIIGSGLIGYSVGLKLLVNGFKVKIFDFNYSGKSSNAAVGMLAPLIEAKPLELELFKLMEKSKKKWDSFEKELKKYSSIDIKYKKNSSIMVANDFAEIEKLKFKQKFFKRLGTDVYFLDQIETLKLEPFLSKNVQGSLYCKDQDQVDPINLLKSLKDSFVKNSGEIRVCKVDKIVLKNNKVGVKIDNEIFFSEKVILASGIWSDELIKKSFSVNLKSKPLKGISLKLKSKNKKDFIKHNLWFKNIYVAPRNNGEIVAGATENEKGFDNEIDLGELYYMTKNLWESLPVSEDFNVIELNSGLRPSTFDGLPIIGSLENISKNIIYAYGHYRNGVLLAPITSEMVLELVTDKLNIKTKKTFSPSRLLINN